MASLLKQQVNSYYHHRC